MTYKQAAKIPKGGAVAGNENNMLAWYCQAVAVKYCMNPDKIYDWAKSQHLNYDGLRYAMAQAQKNDELSADIFEAILWDKELPLAAVDKQK